MYQNLLFAMLIIFTALSRRFLNETSSQIIFIIQFLQVYGSKECGNFLIWCHCSAGAKSATVSPITAFAMCKVQISTQKKQITLHYFYDTSFGFANCYCCSVTKSCPTLCGHLNCSMPGFPLLHNFLQLAPCPWVGDAIQPSHPLSPPSPPVLNLSQHQGVSNEWVLRIRWPKNWSFSFSISPFNESSGLISFRIDWFDFLAVQGTLKSLFQRHSLKASILW